MQNAKPIFVSSTIPANAVANYAKRYDIAGIVSVTRPIEDVSYEDYAKRLEGLALFDVIEKHLNNKPLLHGLHAVLTGNRDYSAILGLGQCLSSQFCNYEVIGDGILIETSFISVFVPDCQTLIVQDYLIELCEDNSMRLLEAHWNRSDDEKEWFINKLFDVIYG